MKFSSWMFLLYYAPSPCMAKRRADIDRGNDTTVFFCRPRIDSARDLAECVNISSLLLMNHHHRKLKYQESEQRIQILQLINKWIEQSLVWAWCNCRSQILITSLSCASELCHRKCHMLARTLPNSNMCAPI